MVYVAKRCQKYLFLRFLPEPPSVPVRVPWFSRLRALECRRGGCSLPFLFPSCPSFFCACSFLKSPSQFPREALGSVVLLRAIETPVLGRCRCFPVQMRAAPRGSEGKGGGRRGKMSKSAGQAGENRKKPKKVEKKSLKSLEIRQRALPLQSRSGRGASVPPPRIGGSSLNRKKEARAGPAEPAPSGRGKLRPVQGKKTKVVLYNEEFDPGSG